MNKIGYDDIRELWEDEKNHEKLQYLDDLKLSLMTDYLSNIRRLLAETPSGNTLQVDLLKEEGVNVEFMIKDLLLMRRNKILFHVLNDEKMSGNLTLAEEEFYNRLRRGLESHTRFVNEILTGNPAPTMRIPDSTASEENVDSLGDEVEDSSREYIMVRFLRPVKDTIMGLDEIVYGPFEKEDVATIPTANAKIWLRNGTVTRIVQTENKRGD